MPTLDGVISGEHGIGITKLDYLTDEELAPFAQYKQQVDPQGHFNRGKLLREATASGARSADLSDAYTPSFGLMGHESLIMQQSDIGAIADSVKNCRGVSIKHWQEFEDVADHCTVCHKCLTPCPVNIDFGDVSMNMRNLLRKMGQKSFRPGNAAAMLMLNATRPETVKLAKPAPHRPR